MLAANLIDLGRTAESVGFYEKSLASAKADNDLVAEAATRRVYGRAQIAVGEYDQGRKEMLTAAADYEMLATRRAFDHGRMFEQAAETYRRLIWVELQANQLAALGKDLVAMEALVEKVKDPIRYRTLTSGLDELRATIDAKIPKTNQPLAATPEDVNLRGSLSNSSVGGHE